MDFTKYPLKKVDLKKIFSYSSNEKGMTLVEVMFAITFSFILLLSILTVYNTNHFILFSTLNKTEIHNEIEHIDNFLSAETAEEVTVSITDTGNHLTITNTDTSELIYNGIDLVLHFNGIEKYRLTKVSNFNQSVDNGSLVVTFTYKETDFNGRYTLIDNRFDEDKMNTFREGGL